MEGILFVIWIIGAFITFFFQWKKYGDDIVLEWKDECHISILGSNISILVLLKVLAWYLYLPALLAWRLLEKITGK